jgi:methylated-DNA-[protein]-cysteine S-methyltransferase
MSATEYHLEDALRRGARAEVEPRAASAVDAALAEAERLGLIDVAVATMESPLGDLLLAATPRGVVRIAYDPERRVLDELAGRISRRVVEAPGRLDPLRRQLDEFFAARRRRFELDLDFALTSRFGRDVLEGAAHVPAGHVITYGELADRIGHPRAARAVGNALSANPIPIVLPCHRVVPASGGLGKYTGGVERKAFLLELERN